MDPLTAAAESGDSIGGLASLFMIDMDTYARGAELGFEGIDFYIAGRGGALGDVPAGVVTAAFVYFEPGYVAASWERSAAVMSRRDAAEAFATVCHDWAEAKMPDDDRYGRLAELAGKLADGASVAGAPLFAGWRALPEPSPDRPAALALHRINGLRELRGALHAAAVLTHGIDPPVAVARRTPYMLGVFGWPEPHPVADEVRDVWKQAQAATEVALAPAYATLTESERREFVELVNGAQAAVTAG